MKILAALLLPAALMAQAPAGGPVVGGGGGIWPNYWTRSSGTLSPTTSTDSVAIGTTLPSGAPAGTLGANVLYSPNGCLNVLAFGADPTGVAASDDALAAARDAAVGGDPAVQSGCVWLPGAMGANTRYKLTRTFYYQGDNGLSFTLAGDNGKGPSRATMLVWAGDPGTPAIYSLGGNNVQFRDLTLNASSSAPMLYGMWVTATNTLAASVTTNISSISRSSNLVTVQTDAAHGELAGYPVRVAGVADSTFNGLFIVQSVADSTHYTYYRTGANGSSSGGTSTLVKSAPSSGTTVTRVGMSIPYGSNSAAVRIGQGLASTEQVDNVLVENTTLQGDGVNSKYAFYSLNGGNVKNMALRQVSISGFTNPVDTSNVYAGTVRLDGVSVSAPGGSTIFKVGASATFIDSAQVECQGACTGGQIVFSGSDGNLTITGSSVEAAGPADAVMGVFGGALTLIGNKFDNQNGVPFRWKLNNTPQSSSGTDNSIWSVNNFYRYATTAAPFYREDGTTLIANNPVSSPAYTVTSILDSGGTGSPYVRLPSFFGWQFAQQSIDVKYGGTITGTVYYADASAAPIAYTGNNYYGQFQKIGAGDAWGLGVGATRSTIGSTHFRWDSTSAKVNTWGSSTGEGGCTTATNLVVDASNNAKVSSGSYSFTSEDVGGTVTITAGAGWSTGAYNILSVSSGAATLDRSPAAVNTTGGTFATNIGRMYRVPGVLGSSATTFRICDYGVGGAPTLLSLLP